MNSVLEILGSFFLFLFSFKKNTSCCCPWSKVIIHLDNSHNIFNIYKQTCKKHSGSLDLNTLNVK